MGLVIGRSTDNRTSVSFEEEVTKKIHNAIDQCSAETGVEREVLKIARDGNYMSGDKYEKLIHCCYVKSGYAYENGRIKVKEATMLFPKEYATQVEKVIRDCDKELNDPVKNTYQAFVCFQENSPVRMGL
uniref:Odorant Binding Protein 24 n=1 Tax=Dendrolimus punctatus TaxID=238572 RepID=A0A2K8GKM7_9NEOP|nr:Odorant Binding Protein 24 [Dendrolimus punctatus]